MVNFAFWNVGRKPLDDLIARLVESHAVDVLILAECLIPANVLLYKLNEGSAESFHFPFGLCERIKIFTRFSREFLVPIFEDSHLSIRRLRLPARGEILLAAAHLPSKMHMKEDEQSFHAVDLAKTIRQTEDSVGHQRTVLVGDLNMNPFEKGMVAATGLNGVMSRAVAFGLERTVRGRKLPFFYNPMWSHFGDLFGSSPGTYYHAKAPHVNYYWNMFDQVLLRAELARAFRPEHLEILTAIGQTSLTNPNGRPDSRAASDHLPILFKLDF